ncbi:MAG: hypothetical protein RLP44_28365 [Aggregatilineales bacterium]
MKKYFALICVLMLIMMIVPVLAQDDGGQLQPDEDPTFATVPMTNGFSPDPWIVTVLAGGPVNMANEAAEGCFGGVAAVPDVNIEWLEESTGAVRVFFMSLADTTIIIRDPEGNFLCNDDSGISGANPLDPAVLINAPMVGTYNIWIGTYLQDELAAGYLMITEFADTYPGQIISNMMGTIIEPE